MMKNLFLHFVLTVAISTFALALSAQNDYKINIQGTLQGVDGAPVPNGAQELIFRLYDQPTEGTPLWVDTAMVEIAGGVYSYNLGSGNPLVPAHFSSLLYMGVVVNGEELTPRTELTYAPYTLHTGFATYADTAAVALLADPLFKAEVLTPTRIIRGAVNPDATIAAGSGFTVSHVDGNDYHYRIDYDEYFASGSETTVVAQPAAGTANTSPCRIITKSGTNSSAFVDFICYDCNGNPSNVPYGFNFIIIGPKN
jgi:hypothetical protein